jgi:Glycosyl transferases group 1
MISQVFGRELSPMVRRHRIIIGPRYPSAPGYWSDRIYIVLGHAGFFLAPEVPEMREEGLEPGVHYALLGDDPVGDIRYWLARPVERARIARQGQELVLSRFTYEDRVRELCETIHATMGELKGRVSLGSNGAHAAVNGEPSASINQEEPSTAINQEPSLARRVNVRDGSVQRFDVTGSLRFRHRRKLGDIVYSLPALRHLGGGILYLDPTSLDGTQDQAYWRRQFETLIPYLEQQPYLHEVRIHEGEAFDVDLDAYLHTTHGTPGDRVTIAANHFIGLGLEVPDEFSPWLAADSLPVTYPIVIHRSPRYHGSVDYSFLPEVAEGLYCVGSAEERAPFEAIGAQPLITQDVRALAMAIKSCGVFIGNQSLPLALAAGLGKPRMVEESDRLPNATFGGPDEFVLTKSLDENRAGLQTLFARSRGRAIPLPQVVTTSAG